MPAASFLLRALSFGLLLLAAAATLLLPGRVVAPGLLFVILSIYAHASARIIGVTGPAKALLFLEMMPFFGFATVHLGKLETVQVFLVVVAAALAGAAILAAEYLWVRGSATFTTSLGFIAACGLAGLGLAVLPVLTFLGLVLAALTVAGYGVARRARG